MSELTGHNVQRLRNRGQTIVKIAKEHGLTKGQVQALIDGVKRRAMLDQQAAAAGGLPRPSDRELIRLMDEEGLTLGVLALRYNVTRNVVAGWSRRARKGLGVSAKPSPIRRTPKQRPLADIPGHQFCHYIIGDLRDPGARWCGDPVARPGGPYCAPHHALCHVSRP